MVQKNADACCQKSDLVAIVGATLGIFLVIAVLFLMFAKESIALLIPLLWGFVVLGIVIGAFQTRILRGKK